MPGQQLRQRFERVPRGGAQMNHDLARRALLQQRDRLELGRDDPRRLVVSLELSAHEEHRVRFDQVGVFAERLWKDDDLDAARDVLQHEDRHAVPLLRLERTQTVDDAGDPDVGHRLREVRHALRAEGRQIGAETLERVAAHVEAERFLFERKLLRFRPWWRIRKRNGGAGFIAVRAAPAEQLMLTLLAIPLVAAAMLDRAVDRPEQARAPRPY